jgi:hypothetical protein
MEKVQQIALSKATFSAHNKKTTYFNRIRMLDYGSALGESKGLDIE